MIYEFQSGFSGHIKGLLEHRAVMGRDTEGYKRLLKNFDQFCLKNHPQKNSLTQEIAFDWCNDGKGGAGTKRACVMRNMGRYLTFIGEEAYIMPQMFFPTQRNALPYMFTDDELKNFFDATDHYPRKRNPLLEYTIPVIFRLQYACGMRPQEVRKLRCLDFDFTQNTIYITEGKHNKDRQLAVSSEVMEMCKKYDKIANRFIPNRVHFFQSPSGEAYSNTWLLANFHKCWEMSGNSSEQGSAVPYDLRHNYASRKLMHWIDRGQDLNVYLPYLSVYMGHESFKATFYYIHLLPERLACTDFTNLDGILPEVRYEEHS